LLATGAVVATAAIALRADRVDAALVDKVQLPALTPEVPPLNVCAATARRLLDIARRNEIRREANLPLLSITKELRRMKDQEKLEEFERFEAVYGKAVWEEVLKARREAEGNPNWRPNWMVGMCLQSQLRKTLWEQFRSIAAAESSNRDLQISRIRLSDRTSRLHPRHVVPKPAQAYETEVPVKVLEWIAPALASPDLAEMMESAAQGPEMKSSPSRPRAASLSPQWASPHAPVIFCLRDKWRFVAILPVRPLGFARR
jgi:hypothetical protein